MQSRLLQARRLFYDFYRSTWIRRLQWKMRLDWLQPLSLIRYRAALSNRLYTEHLAETCSTVRVSDSIPDTGRV